MTKYVLKARAQMHGEVKEPGYVFELEDGEKGPMRTVGLNQNDPKDELLYEEFKEPEPREADENDPAPSDVAPTAAAPGSGMVPTPVPADDLSFVPPPAEPAPLTPTPLPPAAEPIAPIDTKKAPA